MKAFARVFLCLYVCASLLKARSLFLGYTQRIESKSCHRFFGMQHFTKAFLCTSGAPLNSSIAVNWIYFKHLLYYGSSTVPE